jgi:hypothetical protein
MAENVRFTPESGHERNRAARPLGAKNGHPTRCQRCFAQTPKIGLLRTHIQFGGTLANGVVD